MSISRSPAAAALLVATTLGCSSSAPGGSNEALRQEVFETERAFAKTMADRDHAAFVSFLAEEAVFFSGETPLRGVAAVGAHWKRFYDGPAAPFSWEPEQVEVLGSGTLAQCRHCLPLADTHGPCRGCQAACQHEPGWAERIGKAIAFHVNNSFPGIYQIIQRGYYSRF